MYHFSWRSELILRLRWVLMPLLGGFVVFYELNEHGLKTLQDLQFNFIFEVSLMGLVLPLLGSSLLTKMAHPQAWYARKEAYPAVYLQDLFLLKSESVERAKRSRPKDQSLEAYKAWITEIANRLTTQKTAINLTEEEWIENWEEFWEQMPGD